MIQFEGISFHTLGILIEAKLVFRINRYEHWFWPKSFHSYPKALRRFAILTQLHFIRGAINLIMRATPFQGLNSISTKLFQQ